MSASPSSLTHAIQAIPIDPQLRVDAFCVQVTGILCADQVWPLARAGERAQVSFILNAKACYRRAPCFKCGASNSSYLLKIYKEIPIILMPLRGLRVANRNAQNPTMIRSAQAQTTSTTEMSDDALSHDLIGSGAWVLPLVIATFLIYREFKKSAERGRFALALLMIVGVVIILVPMFGSIVLVLSMLALILFLIERLL